MGKNNVSVKTRKIIKKYLDSVNPEFAYSIAETLAYDERFLSNKLGFRTAGSDAEHRAADYLMSVMKEIGLGDVEKVPVKIDKWQFNDASLKIGGTDINIMPASYASNGTDSRGITAQIADLGEGFHDNYIGNDVKGKIALVGVNQAGGLWIDQYLAEAAYHGAVALVTYDIGGYARFSDDMINMQDICSPDLLPCVSISHNQYKQIKDAMEKGCSEATLVVDNVIEVGKGTGYNVCGKIRGLSSKQQLVVSGHYDVYFNGFQDDSCAIGLILSMAKTMKDAGFVPQNDIVFVCHAAEEWGASGTAFDWTIGAWRMIYDAHPEWAGKIKALFNFELPAMYDGMEKLIISCVPEFASIVKDFTEDSSICISPMDNIYSGGISSEIIPADTREDGVSYRHAGVPYFINMPTVAEGEDSWILQRYHTVADDRGTYSRAVMHTNLNVFGALAIYVDSLPALEMDLTGTCDDLAKYIEPDLWKTVGADLNMYEDALEQLRRRGDSLRSQAREINQRYANAVNADAPADELADIYNEGRVFTRDMLKRFKFIQDELIGIIITFGISPRHAPYQANVATLESIVDALSGGGTSKQKLDKALEFAPRINFWERHYFKTCAPVVEIKNKTFFEDLNPDNIFWGTGKGFEFADTKTATLSLIERARALEACGTVIDNFSEELSIYRAALEKQKELMKSAIEKEINVLDKLICM